MIYIFSAIILYFFSGLLLYLLQRRILFNTSGKPQNPSYYGLDKINEVQIITQDGISLLSWYFKGLDSKPILIYFHGNSFDIGERAYRIKKYIEKGFSILLISWRGFSGNKGKPNEKNLYLDGEAAIKWVLNNLKFQLNDLIIYGESLGTGVAVELGTRYKFCSIVLEAPFTSIPDIAKLRYKIFPTKFLVKDKFNNLDKIKKIKSPLLIISGKKDEIIPHNHSQILYNEAIVFKDSVFIDEAMHNNLYDFDIQKNVINFNLKIWKQT
tara:strand:- start:779 stop:1582 length:804 start_codon:yes stop_codon:yes gene_type:complete